MSERAWGLFICSAIVLVPLTTFVPIQYTDVWYSAYIGLFSAFMFAFTCYLWPWSKLLSLLSGLCLYSTIIVSHQHPKSILLLIQLNFALVAIRKISKLNWEWRFKILIAMLCLWSIQVLMMTLQAFNIDPIFNSLANASKDDTVGISGSHNQVGLFFAVTAPLVMYINPILVSINVICVALSTTTVAMLALCASMVTYAYLEDKVSAFFLFVLLVAVVFGYFKFYDVYSNAKVRERKEIILHSVRDVERGYAVMKHDQAEMKVTTSPWNGFGLGNFMRISPYTQYDLSTKTHLAEGQEPPKHVYEHAHNDYVEAWYELGRPGIILVMLLLVEFIIDFIISEKTRILNVCFCAVLAQLLCALGIYTIQTAISGICLIVFYGLFKGELSYAKNRQRDNGYFGKIRKHLQG